jgi:kynurenine formamidase
MTQPPGADVAAAERHGTAGGPGGASRFIDLSVLISEELPCWWPTHLPFQHKTWCWFIDRDTPAGHLSGRFGPYTTRWMLMDEHTGTHFDAPAHFLPPPGAGVAHEHPLGATTAEQVPLSQLSGRPRVMDVRHLVGTSAPGESPLIDAAQVQAWEAEAGPLLHGDVLLLRCDWDDRYLPGAEGAAYAHDPIVARSIPAWPAPTPDMATYIAGRGVRCLGTDAPSIGAAQDGQPVHVAGLGAGLVYLECLANLASIPTDDPGATFFFAPIKVRGGTGAPGRAFVTVPQGAKTGPDTAGDAS